MLLIFWFMNICSAEISLLWQKDISTYFPDPSDSILDIKPYSNGRIALLLGGWSSNTKKLLVLDSSGNFVYENTVTNGANSYLHGHSGSSYIIWGLYSSPSKMRVYEPSSDGTYTYVDIPADLGNTTGGDESVFNIDPSILIVTEGSYLKKYRLESTGTTLSHNISSGINGNNFILNWDSELNAQYQIQSSTTLTNWIDIGGILTGTGERMTWANSLTNSKSFYRVIKK